MMLQPANTGELQTIIRDARTQSTPLRLIGRGTWPAGVSGGEVASTPLDLSLFSGIVEYVPGDLTLTAGAATTIAEIDAATAAHHQWCPLLPWGADDGSLGATFATATTGPCSRTLGAPRDVAIGVQFVDGTGALARGGGRVVKNVAGFDLTRLLVGSWGTLGAITEISIRLRAQPVVDETWTLHFTPTDDAAKLRLAALRRGPLAPLTCEILTTARAAALGLPNASALIRLGGNTAFVAAARAAVRGLGRAEPCDTAVWSRYRALDPHPRTVTTNAFADPLSKRIKTLFDPAHVLNRFAGQHGTERIA